MVVIIYCCIGGEDEVTTLKREQRGPMIDVDIFNVLVQKVHVVVVDLHHRALSPPKPGFGV